MRENGPRRVTTAGPRFSGMSNAMRQELTILIPCKNERQNIGACIESVRAIANEILIADSGSTDGTLEIVSQHGGCRVIQREWIGYADFKNWAIPQARYAWVLIVDADERLTPELAAEIQQILAAPPEDIDAYRIRHRPFFLGHEIRHCGRNTSSTCRLIRRDVCRYRPMQVHEEIDIDGDRVRLLQHRFLHYEFRSLDHYFAKRLRYAKLTAQESWARGKRTGIYGLFVRPLLRFVQLYFQRLGFLDGLPGFLTCVLMAFHTFLKQALLWELQHATAQEEVERALGTVPSQQGDPLPSRASPPAASPSPGPAVPGKVTTPHSPLGQGHDRQSPAASPSRHAR